MLHINKLKGKMTEKGFTVATISERIGMDSSTFYRKLQKNKFSLEEAENISQVLELTHEEAIEIFFAA